METTVIKPTEFEKSVAIGKVAYGNTSPPVFLCGNCRTVRIAEGDGVCPACRNVLLIRAGYKKNDLVDIWILLGAIVVVGLIVGAVWTLSGVPQTKKVGERGSAAASTNIR